MIYKHEIEAFNEFWLDCDTEMLFSLLVSKNDRYRILAYRNDYYYIALRACTPNRIYFEEMRSVQDISFLQNNFVHYVEKQRDMDLERNLVSIKRSLIKGHYVLAAVDLYAWIEENMCYQNHHVEHYALLHGYDDKKNLFYTMETDNERYREFLVSEQKLSEAMSMASTLQYQVVIFELEEKLQGQPLYTWKDLRGNAKKIIRSIKPLLRKKFWLFSPKDFRNLFYRDMTVMYLMQINCRMKANRRLFAYLHEKEGFNEDFSEKAEGLEMGWRDVRRSISKLYFKENAYECMEIQNEKIYNLLLEEKEMWEKFRKETKVYERR